MWVVFIANPVKTYWKSHNIIYTKGASQSWMLNAVMGREAYLFCRERTWEQRGEVSCWSPCRRSMADGGRRAPGWPAKPGGQPCSQTCDLDLCVKHPLCWEHGSQLLGISLLPKQNATNSGKRNPTTLGGVAFRYSVVVTVPSFVRRGLCLQIKYIIIIEKDQKMPKKCITESGFGSRQRWSSKPEVSQLQAFSAFLVLLIT